MGWFPPVRLPCFGGGPESFGGASGEGSFGSQDPVFWRASLSVRERAVAGVLAASPPGEAVDASPPGEAGMSFALTSLCN